MGDTLTKDADRAGAGAQLAEILAMTLIEKGIVDRENFCAELEMLASGYREDSERVGLAASLSDLATSLRAVSRT